MATAGRGVRKATKLGGASEQDSAQSDTPQGPVDRITLVAQVTGWAPEECASVLEDYDGDEQAAISAIIEGTADAFKKVENKRTKPVEKPTKAPSYHKSSSDKSTRPPRADKNGEHTDTQRDGKQDRRRSANPKGDRPKKPFGKENGARPPAAKEDHTAPQPSGETQTPTQTSAHTVNPPSQPTAPTQTPPTESSNAGPAPAGSADTTVNKASGSKPQRAWDQTRTWGAAPRSSSPSNPPRERNIPPRQQNQHTQNQNATPQPTTETQSPAPTAVPEKAPAQSQAPAKPAQPATQHTAPAPSVAAPTTQPKTSSPAAAAPSPAVAAPTAQTQPIQSPQTQAAQSSPGQSGSRHSAPRQNTKPGQTTTTWKPKETQPKAPSPQGGVSQATSQAAPAPAAVAPPQKPAVAQPVQPAPQPQAVAPAANVHQAQAPAVSQARHTPVVLPPTADVTAANIHLQFGSISGLGSVPEVNKGVVDYESQQRYGSGAIGGSGQLGGEVYQDSHSVGVENDLGIQQPHVAPFPYHFGVGMPLQGLPPHYQPSFDPNDPEHLMPGMLQYYDPSQFQYQHPRDPADPKFPNRNSGSYGPRDANKFGQDAASTQAQTQPQQQGQQQQQSGQSPVQQHYMPVGQYGAGPMYYPYSYGPYQQPQYPPHFQRMLYKQPYGFPNANPGYPGPSSTLGGYDENYKGSVYGAQQMPPFMFPDSNIPKVPSSQQAGLSTSPPKSAFSPGGAGSAGSASDITSGAFKSQAGDYKGYQNAGNNPQSFYNLAPAQSQFNQQQPISFGTPHNMLQQPQQPYQQQTRTSQQQY